MIKFVLSGLWVVAVTLGSVYFMNGMLVTPDKVEKKPSYFGGIDYVKMDLVGVPVIRDGNMQGYVLAQLVYTADRDVLDKLTVKPDVFIKDAAIKKIYADDTTDFRKLKKYQVEKLLTDLRDGANERYGKPILKEILVDRLDYMKAEDVRAGGRLPPKSNIKVPDSVKAGPKMAKSKKK